MNIPDISTLMDAATAWVQALFPGIAPETIRMAEAGLLILLALILLVGAFKILRRPKPRNTPSTNADIPHDLQEKGEVVDVLATPGSEKVSVRCVITSAKTNRIKCEIIERLDGIKAGQGEAVTCFFAPLKTRDGRVNSFTATLLESDRSGRNKDRLILSVPTTYAMAPRRKHSRKRVADQQFIRVKLWLEDPVISDISFEDATPQIGVNSFTSNDKDQEANGVLNISARGLGLSILNRVIPETCTEDSSVVINLFMFNFREKTFKPYWYAGTVRSMEEGRPGFTRMGLEFNAAGRPDPETGKVHWTTLK